MPDHEWNKPRNEREANEYGIEVDARSWQHPNYNPRRKHKPRHKGIPHKHWQTLLTWVPYQIAMNEYICRRRVANTCYVQVRTVVTQAWMRVIYEHWQDQLEWELDPNWEQPKRGTKIKRLKPTK